jgi:predicted NBD/HSP70 family sugar kinase
VTDSSTSARRETLLAAGPPATVTMFTALLTRGTMTRGELGAHTGFSAGAVTKALRPLIESGHVRELPEQWSPSGAGRPALPLQVDAERAYLVGVKITADEVIGVLTDLRSRVVDRHRVALPAIVEAGHHAHTVDADDALAAIVELVGRLVRDDPSRRDRLAGVGVAVSGDVDARAGLVRFSPLLGWRGISLAERLEAQLGLPTTVENDVRALTVAEQWFGVGLDTSSFALVTVGTGVGCGIVADGALLTGAHGVVGELGHLPVDPAGPECHCGGTGCVEALIGEAALLDRIAEAVDQPVRTVADARALATDGAAASTAVRAIFADVGRVLGLALATVANLLGPEKIVLTGETMVAYDLFADDLTASYEAQCFGAAQQCTITVRPLQFEHWARGAAAVAIARLVRAA